MKKILGFTLFFLFALTLTVQADTPVECYRHSECTDDELCVNTVCTPSAQPLSECASDKDCDADAFITESCVDGYCKKNGVYCENPAGFCYYENDETSCFCEDGHGSGSGSVGPSSEPVLTDEQLYQQCQEGLALNHRSRFSDIYIRQPS